MNNTQGNSGGFNAKRAAEIIDATPRAIVDWGVRGFIEPGVKESTGQGDRKIYSAENLVLMSVLRELFRRGLTREQVEKLLAGWRKTSAKRQLFNRWFDLTVRPGAEWLLVIDDSCWFMFHHTGGHIDTSGLKLPEADLIPTAKCVISLNLTAIKQEILRKLQ